jgi:structural maintenance of chromosome 3 (chondroitin sulfate proteoglycan 6)
MKKWNDFSGGEKTVIALSIVLTLQRCEPAPFYVLDEVDAALDSVYVQKIAELLSK